MASVNANPSLTTTSAIVGNARWLAPEIIDPPRGRVTVASKAADVFAFGVVVAEVVAGKLPFEEMSDSGAACQILRGARPKLPQYTEDNGFTPQLRELVEKCWSQDPAERPTIDEVVATWKLSDDQNNGGIVPDTTAPPDELRPASPTDTERQPAPPSKHLLSRIDATD